MNDRDALIAAIIEKPAEDTPRLMLADWYEENDQPDRAEFIRLGCQLASMNRRNPRYAGLDERYRALLAAHKAEWTAELTALGVTYADFHRGMVENINIPIAAFTAHSEALFKLAPIDNVQLYTAESPLPGEADCAVQQIEDAAQCPQLGRIKYLTLRGKLGDDAVEAFAQSPYLRQLEALDLCSNHIGDAGLASLASCRSLEHLRALGLGHNRFTPEGVAAFAANAPFLPQLTELYLGHANVGEVGLNALSGVAWERLRQLDLFECGLGAGAMAAWNPPSRLRNMLEWVNIGNNGLNNDDVRHITGGDQPWRQLKYLNMCNHPFITDDCVPVLLDRKNLPALERLHLGGTGVVDTVDPLVAAPNYRDVEVYSFPANDAAYRALEARNEAVANARANANALAG